MVTLFEALLWLFVLAIVGTVYWYRSIPKNLPPGPRGLPLIGSSWDYRDGGKQYLVLMEQVKTYGPIFKVYIADKLVIVLGDFDTMHEAMVKQGDVFAGRPQNFGFFPERTRDHGVIFSQGELWKEQRRFALSTLRDFGAGRPILEQRIREEIDYLNDRLLDYAKTGKAFDPQSTLLCAVTNVISFLIFERRFSYDDEEFVHQLTTLSRNASGSGVGFLTPFILSKTISTLLQFTPLVRRLKKEIDSFLDYVEREMVKTAATFDTDAEPSNYIHAFMKASQDRNGGSFTDKQLLAMVMDLFAAGTETTSSTLRSALLFLAHHPDIQEKLYKEIQETVGVNSLPTYADRIKMPFTEAVIMETQRLACLVPMGVMRRTMEPTKLMGYDIPEDTLILPLLVNVLHSPDLYPNPSQFNPCRFLDADGKVIRDQKLITFQIGKRICLGESMARMELFLFVIGLISKYRFYFPDDQPKPTMEPIGGLLLTPRSYKICVEARSD